MVSLGSPKQNKPLSLLYITLHIMPLGSLHGQCMNNMPTGVEGGCLAEPFFFFCPCLVKGNDCYVLRGRLLGSSLLHNMREVDRLKIALGAQVSLVSGVRYWRSEGE